LFGEGQYEFDAANTYYGVYNADFETYDLVYAEKGEVVVTVDEEKNITLTGYVICEDAVQYNVTMKSKIQRPHLDFDSPDTPVDRIFTAQDTVTIVDLVEDASMIYFSVQSVEHGDVFDFYMIVEAADPDIVLPVGMYEINDSGEYNTVLAGQGVDMWMGIMTPGFYGFVDAEGYILEPMYFLVGGTVEVRKNDDGSLYVEINAFNSYDVPVHIIYDASATGVEHIDATIVEMSKQIRGGQLLIMRNGKTYNVLGAQVK
jgi:hypothetical protein